MLRCGCIFILGMILLAVVSVAVFTIFSPENSRLASVAAAVQRREPTPVSSADERVAESSAVPVSRLMTSTPIASTRLPFPETSTSLPPTSTPIPPTLTPLPPTATTRATSVPPYTVSRFSAARTRYTHGTVNLREGPGTNYALVGSVAADTRLRAVGQSGDWYLIEQNGREVFIAGWLTFDAPRAPAPAPNRQQVSAAAPPQSAAPAQPATAVPAAAPAQPAYSCNCSKTCGAMSSCAEAYYQLNNCGCRRRDGDNDGVPCESICPGG